MVMYENILKDAQEVKRRLSTIGENADENVICELLESFGPNYGLDRIMSMITENWDSSFQNVSSEPGPSSIDAKSMVQCSTEKILTTTQRSCMEHSCIERSDVSSDSDDDRDYYVSTNWDDISIVDTVIRSSPLPLDLCGNASTLNDNSEAAAASPEVECLEENNNDPNNNLSPIQILEELRSNSPDIDYERQESSIDSPTESTENSDSPKPGCSKDSPDMYQPLKSHFKLHKEAEQIYALLPSVEYNTIYKTLCKNDFAKNRVELALWDLLPDERPKAQVLSKRKLIDDTCLMECKKSISEKSDCITSTEKCSTTRKKTSLKKGKQLYTKDEDEAMYVISKDAESASLMKKTDIINKEVIKELTNLDTVDNNINQLYKNSIAQGNLTKLHKSNDDINTSEICNLGKPASSETNLNNEELRCSKDLMSLNRESTSGIHSATAQTNILQPPKLVLNKNNATSSGLLTVVSSSNCILAPPKLKYISGNQKPYPKISETEKIGKIKEYTDKKEKTFGVNIAYSHPSVYTGLIRDNATISQNKILTNTETSETGLSKNNTSTNLQSMYISGNCREVNNSTNDAKNISIQERYVKISQDFNRTDNRQEAVHLSSIKTNTTNMTEQLKSLNHLQAFYGENQKKPNIHMATFPVDDCPTYSTQIPDSISNHVKPSTSVSFTTVSVQQNDFAMSNFVNGINFNTSDISNDQHDKNIVHIEIEKMNDKQKETANNAEKSILNQKALTAYHKLIPMFPDISTDYIKQLCKTHITDETVLLDDTVLQDLVEHLLNRGEEHQSVKKLEPLLVPDICDVNEQYANLLAIFPEADPAYLRDIAEQIYNDPDKTKEFVQSKLEKPDYPTREQYLAKKKITEQQKQYTTDFRVQQFLEIFPDPFSHFEDTRRQCRFHADAVDFLKHHFNKTKVYIILNVYAQYAHNLSLTAKALETLNPNMKNKRFYPLIQTENIPLLQECAFIEHKIEIKQYLVKLKEKEDNEFKELKETNGLFECQCCYDNECMPTRCSICEDGHIFCNSCIVKSTDMKLADGETHVYCLLNCGSEFNLSVLQEILPPTKFSILLQKRQEAEVMAAGLEGLVSCPFCHFASIPPQEDKVFKCFNPDCMKESCRLCKELNHVPLKCNEVKSDAARLYLEEKMTEALVRKCYHCSRTFFKEDGCNKMTCLCGAQMCYICDKPVTGYEHFDGQGSEKSNLCPLWSDDRRMNAEAVIKVCQETMKHIKEKNPMIEINTDPLLPKLPPKRSGPHDDIAHANVLPAHIDRIVRQIP